MVTNSSRTLLLLLTVLTHTGCQEERPVETNAADNDPAAAPVDAEPKKSHQHSDDDVLVWIQGDIEDSGFVISLGHHGVHFHGGDEIEPAVTITSGKDDVPDAIVFNSLVAEDGETIVAEERPTVFEPKTEDEPAHYAQGALIIPKDAKKYTIRFRIKLPGIDTESMYDIEQEVSH